MRKNRILWASTNCLLDTSSGASISIREMLKQLSAHQNEVKVTGCTIFDNENGLSGLGSVAEKVLSHKENEYVIINDGSISHTLLKTNSTNVDTVKSQNISNWIGLYRKLLLEFKPDLVFFYGGGPGYVIPSEARKLNIPSAAYLVNGSYWGDAWCRDVDLIITDTHATSNMYKARSKLNVIPIGKFISSSVKASTHSRQRVTMINPSAAKGGAFVALLSTLLEESRPDIVFEIVESRSDWNFLVEQIRKKTGNDYMFTNVVRTENVADISSVYGRSRVILAPSLWWESGARVLAEAMINGIPAIVTNRGGNKEMIGNAGVVVEFPESFYQEPYNKIPDALSLMPLAQLIERFFDEDNYYEALVSRAREQARNFDIERSTQAWRIV